MLLHRKILLCFCKINFAIPYITFKSRKLHIGQHSNSENEKTRGWSPIIQFNIL